MGPPGCGKHTQANLFKEKHNFYPLSIDNMIYDKELSKTELGKHALQMYEAHSIITDDVFKDMIK